MMNLVKTRNIYPKFVVSGAAISLALLFGFVSPASASTESECFDFVQGNIPWNLNGTSTWAPANVKKLCTGATKAAEPGRCFDRLMSGGVSWGGGTKWEWKNALSLCRGTGNANQTVSCFQGKISSGRNWKQAIAACGPPTESAAEKACFEFVQGNIPWNLSGTSTWAAANVKKLCSGTNKAAEPGRCFDRLMSGNVSWGGGAKWKWENALKLCRGTSGANSTVDCFQGKIAGGTKWPQAISQCKS